MLTQGAASATSHGRPSVAPLEDDASPAPGSPDAQCKQSSTAAPRRKPLCDPSLATDGKQPRQLFPGYEHAPFDEFDRQYKELLIDRFKIQQDKEEEFHKKLKGYKGELQRLQKIGTQAAGPIKWDAGEEEERKKKQSGFSFARKKRSGVHMKPIDQLKEEIRDDARFRDYAETVLKVPGNLPGQHSKRKLDVGKPTSNMMMKLLG